MPHLSHKSPPHRHGRNVLRLCQIAPWDGETNMVLMEIKWSGSAFWQELVLAPSLQEDLLAIACCFPHVCLLKSVPRPAGSFLSLFIPNFVQPSFICDSGVFCNITPWFRLEMGTVFNLPAPVIMNLFSPPETLNDKPLTQRNCYSSFWRLFEVSQSYHMLFSCGTAEGLLFAHFHVCSFPIQLPQMLHVRNINYVICLLCLKLFMDFPFCILDIFYMFIFEY